MIRIYGDFNSCDDQGRVILNTMGALEDIRRYENLLTDGIVVQLYMEEVVLEATLVSEDGVWFAIIDPEL